MGVALVTKRIVSYSCNKALQCNTYVKVNSIDIDYKVELNSLYDYTEGVLVMYTSTLVI